MLPIVTRKIINDLTQGNEKKDFALQFSFFNLINKIIFNLIDFIQSKLLLIIYVWIYIACFIRIAFSHFLNIKKKYLKVRKVRKYFKIISSFCLKLFSEKRLVKTFKVLPASKKSINPIQKYPHITELYACILKIFVTTIDFSINILISFGICLTPKLSK